MPGLTLTGFETQTLADVREVVNTAWRAAFGISTDVSDRSPDGHLIGAFTEVIALIWEVLEAIVSGIDPDKATGALLVALAALTGTEKRPATFSTVTLTLTGTPTTPVTTGSLASTESTEQQFETRADVVIAAADAWADTTLYTLGDIVTSGDNVYLCITTGTSDVTSGPTTEDPDITDGTAHWMFLGAGTGNVDVEARATVSGAVVAVAGDITGRDTPIGGWDGVINVLDADEGAPEMIDPELRALRELELAAPGTSPKDAIRAALLEVADVEPDGVTVFMNVTDVTDGDGVPPHSVECLVRGGLDQDIWDALLANVAAGIRTFGTEAGTATDSEGEAQPEAFSRHDEVNIYTSLSVLVDPDTFPADGADQIKLAIVEYGDGLGAGYDARVSVPRAPAEDVTGVLEVTEVRIYTDAIETGTAWAALTAYSATAGARDVVTNDERSYICITAGTSAASGGPTGTSTDITDGTAHWRFLGATIPITTRQLAAWDTSRITITTTDGTP